MFRAGDCILYEGTHLTDSGAEPPVLCDVKPAVVIEDTPQRVALYVAAGAATKLSRPIDPAQPKPWSVGEWEFIDASWRWHALFLIEPGAWHAVWLRWTPAWDFIGWYVNFQQPLVRSARGFDHRDLQLDIVVAPDRSWRWKDEDDLERSVETGVISAATAARVRREAESVVPLIQTPRYPFTADVPAWRPGDGLPLAEALGNR